MEDEKNLQTTFEDGDEFLDALKEAGVEIEYPEEQDALGVGGDGDYVPRTSSPAHGNKYYMHTSAGGVNECILIENGECIPNCVGYAWGATYEGTGKRPTLSKNNAENWYDHNDGYPRGKEARVGAVIVWAKGKTHDASDGAGHVAICVSYDKSTGRTVFAQSNYGGTRFYLSTMYPPYNLGSTYTFLGFIYPTGIPTPEPTPTPTPTPTDEIKVGDRVVVTGFATADSFGGGARTANYTGNVNNPDDIRFVTIVADTNRPRPYHISVGQHQGQGDRGWVSKDQIKKI